MDYRVSEQFICLSLKPETGRYMVLGNYLSFGVLGAIMMDLILSEHLIIRDHVLSLGKNTGMTGNPAHDKILSKILESKKQRSVKRWLKTFGPRAAWYRKKIQRYFVANGILKVERKRFIGIPYLLHYVSAAGRHQKLVNKYKDIILNNEKPEESELMVMGLIYACKMHRALSDNGPERRKIRKALVKIIKENPLASDINKAIIEMQAAITASIAAVSAASTAGTS